MEVRREGLDDFIDEKMKEAKAGLIPLSERKVLAQTIIELYQLKVGDPIVVKLANFILADDIANKSRMKSREENAWLTDRQLERRMAGETEFKEFT